MPTWQHTTGAVEDSKTEEANQMFEVGQSYFIETWDAVDDGTIENEYFVLAVENTLIKVREPSGEESILNTAAITFVGAREK